MPGRHLKHDPNLKPGFVDSTAEFRDGLPRSLSIGLSRLAILENTPVFDCHFMTKSVFREKKFQVTALPVCFTPLVYSSMMTAVFFTQFFVKTWAQSCSQSERDRDYSRD